MKLKTYDLLIIDDFGLSPIGMINSREILDIVDDRLNFKSTLIASQIPTEAWHSIIADLIEKHYDYIQPTKQLLCDLKSLILEEL